MNAMQVWADAWMQAKRDESDAVSRRRECEDRMIEAMREAVEINEDGTTTVKPAGYTIKIVSRVTRSVDSEKVQELAAAAGLADHLPALFRWKPELNKAQWDHAAQNIRDALAPAITAKPGRPSFTITKD